MRILVLVLMVVAALFCVPRFDGLQRPLHAGMALRMGLDELVEQAELVLEGQVLARRCEAALAERIETEYLIQVERCFLGATGAVFALRVPGGVLDDGQGLLLAGLPQLAAGERVLLFLSQAGDEGVRMPVGLAQGKFRVLEQDGRKLLQRAGADLCLFERDGHESANEIEPGLFEYNAFSAQLQAAVQRKLAHGPLEAGPR